MEELLKFIQNFNNERDWSQFHTPNNLAKSIVLEANELLEHFQFSKQFDDKQQAIEELADILAYCLDLCISLDVDPIEIIYAKYKKNDLKYPVDKAKGNHKKYNEL